MHIRLGGCPAVLLPLQRDIRKGSHLWDCLQYVFTYVTLPMWPPGKCPKSSHILLQHRESAGPMAAPQEKIWNTQSGQVRAVFVPKRIYTMTVGMKVHHLEALVSADRGWACNEFDMEPKGASKYLIGIFSSLFNRHSDELCLRAKPAPQWQKAPEQWRPLCTHPRTSMTVVGTGTLKRSGRKW